MPHKKFPYYPIFLDVEDHDVVIVGGGAVCTRKAETMMRYGANVTVVAPDVTEEIAGWAGSGKINLRRKEYEDGDLDGASIVIASTDDECVNGRVARDCRRRNTWFRTAHGLSKGAMLAHIPDDAAWRGCRTSPRTSSRSR